MAMPANANTPPVEFVATVRDSSERRRRLAALFAELTAGPTATTTPDDGQAIPADKDGPDAARSRRLRREMEPGSEREPDWGGDHPEADPWAQEPDEDD